MESKECLDTMTMPKTSQIVIPQQEPFAGLISSAHRQPHLKYGEQALPR